MAGWSSDYRATTSSAKSLSVRTSVAINLSLEPNTLLLQLKRYDFDHIQQKALKKHDSVFCPKQIILPGGSTYTLSSVLNHIGSSPDDGHYTVTLYDKQSNLFVFLDDSNITENIDISEEMWRKSYIVCYSKD